MRRAFVLFAVALLGGGPLVRAEDGARAGGGDAERGEYVVRHVAMCIYCHTPKDESGALVDEELLAGAPMPVESPWKGVEWATEAPSIAGLPGGYAREDLVRFLVTGVTKSGRRPLPPMPPFRMSREDARDVAAYLSSLESPIPGGGE